MLRDQHRLPEAGTLERGHPLAHRGRVELCRSERGDRIAWAALLGAVERGQAKVDERRHLGALIGELSRAGKWRGARRCAGQTCAGLTPCRATGPCGAAGARAAAAAGPPPPVVPAAGEPPPRPPASGAQTTAPRAAAARASAARTTDTRA